MGIQRPSSMVLLQLAHCFTLRDLVEAVDELLVTLFDGFKASNSLCLVMVGLVCERVGSLGGFPELSLTGLWSSIPTGIICLAGESGERLALVVAGDRGESSNRVSIARSRAPTDLAVLLVPYPEREDEAAERLRAGTRVEYADSDDFEDLGDEVGNCILFVSWPPFFNASFPPSYSESESA